jgi:hypothetical protein
MRFAFLATLKLASLPFGTNALPWGNYSSYLSAHHQRWHQASRDDYRLEQPLDLASYSLEFSHAYWLHFGRFTSVEVVVQHWQQCSVYSLRRLLSFLHVAKHRRVYTMMSKCTCLRWRMVNYESVLLFNSALTIISCFSLNFEYFPNPTCSSRNGIHLIQLIFRPLLLNCLSSELNKQNRQNRKYHDDTDS